MAWRDAVRLVLAGLFLVAGVAHFVTPGPFLQHVPPWVPGAEAVVYVSGVIELVLGGALFATRRRLVGKAAAGFLVAVFPGNIYVAVAGVEVDGLPGGAWPWLRLLLQPLLIAAALWSTDPPAERPERDTSSPSEKGATKRRWD